MSTRVLPLSSKLGFGVGQLAEGVKSSVFNTFVLFYYNQIVGVSASAAAVVLGIAVLFDAVTDPLAGYLSDRTRSAYGRRHPWLIGSALPFAASIVMLFNPPAQMSDGFYVVWLLATAVLVRLFLTLYHIPHLALGAEMAQDYNDRTRVYTYGTFFGAAGGFGFYFFALTFIFPSGEGVSHGLYYAAGYRTLSIAAAVVVFLSIVACVLGTWKEIPHLPRVLRGKDDPDAGFVPMLREVADIFRNRSFRVLFIGSVLGTLVIAMDAVFNTYMGVHFWEMPTEQLRWIGLATILGLPLSFVLAPLLTRLLDKRNTLIATAVVMLVNGNLVICLRLFDVLPPNGDPLILWLVLATFFVGGAIGPVVIVTLNSMLADIADQQELATGRRQEGVLFSARAFSLKATGALGGMLGGVALDLIGFPTEAQAGTVPADVVFDLGLMAGPVTSVFTLMSLFLYLGYRLDRDRVHDIRRRLAARRGAEDPVGADGVAPEAPAYAPPAGH